MTNTFIVIEQKLGEITNVYVRGSALGAQELGNMIVAQGPSWGVDMYHLLGGEAIKLPPEAPHKVAQSFQGAPR